MKSFKQMQKYFSATTFVLAGMGIGILLANPIAGEHPVRWGGALIIISALLCLYPLLAKNK